MKMSKRKSPNDTSVLVKRSAPEKSFSELLADYGFLIGSDDNTNQLEVDQADFVKNFTKHVSEDSKREEFFRGLEKFIEDSIKFKWSLLPTATADSCKVARSFKQDSLFHLLLGIETLRERLSKLLLEKVVLFAYSDGCEGNDPVDGKGMVHMILSQYRWLNESVDGLASSLQEVIKAVPVEVQRVIIALLPEITNEIDHGALSLSLAEMLIGNQDLNASIVSTLSKLLIDADTFPQVRGIVLKTVSSANLEDLPEVLQFVLRNLKVSEMSKIIMEIREYLDFTSSFEPAICSTPVSSQHKTVSKSSGPDIMNSLKRYLLLQKPLFDSWIKVLDSLCFPQVYKSFDLLVIFLMYSFNLQQNKIENLIHKKIKSGEVNENLLAFTFKAHHIVLDDYVRSMLRLAQVLLKSSESVVLSFAGSLCIKIFLHHDRGFQQEVVANLVALVTTGNVFTANSALDTLLELAEYHTTKLVSFTVFIQSLLYHLDKMTLLQIRKVYQILGFLCYQCGSEGLALEDGMHMNIRKQLMSHNLRYHKIGIIGALVAVKTASIKPSSEESPQLSGAERSDGQIIAWLSLVQGTVQASPEAEALFYDELCRVLWSCHFSKVVEEYIDSQILNTFQDTYVVDLPLNEQLLSSEAKPQFELEETSDPIALNIFGVMQKSVKKKSFGENMNTVATTDDTVASSSNKKSKSVVPLLLKVYHSSLKNESHSRPREASPLALSSMFRLLRFRQQQLEGNLIAIDALLICSIVLPELQPPKFWMLTMAEKDTILHSLFFCINWIRELINAFSSVDEHDARLNVVLRLQLLVELQDLACKYVQERNNFSPPVANFDIEDEDAPSLKLSTKVPAKKKKTSKKPKKMKKKKKDDSINVSNLIESDDEEEVVDMNEAAHVDRQINNSLTESLYPFLRELDLEVFKLFEWGVTFRKPCNLFNSEKERDVQLHPKELKLLLEDIFRKFRHCQCGTMRLPFRAPKQDIGFTNFDMLPSDRVVAFGMELLPAFCSLFEKCAQYFQHIISESDGVIDAMIMSSLDSQLISSCMELILKIVNCLISWKGLSLKESNSLFKDAVALFASREKRSKGKGSMEDLIGSTIKFLSKFHTECVTLGCAVALIELMETVVGHSKEIEAKHEVSKTAEYFLKHNWLELDKKHEKYAESDKRIRQVLEAYLKHSDAVLDSLEYLATAAIQKLCQGASGDEVVFQTLNKSLLPSYYHIMLDVLFATMKQYCTGEVQNEDEQFLQWNQAVNIFHILISVIKTHSSRSILRSALLYSRHFVRLFLKHAMPFLDRRFCANVQDALALLKSLQMSTRYMQHVCSHCKSTRHLSLTRQVPHLKRILEYFICRVKVMLSVNKCEDAFWVGNLKNRDLKGNEILSQVTLESDEDEDHENTQEVRKENGSDELESKKDSDDDDDRGIVVASDVEPSTDDDI